MKKLIKSKIFISVMITLAMVVTAFSGVLLLINRNKGDEIIAAETTIDSPMVARKLWAIKTNGTETVSENETDYTLQYDGDNNKVIFDENNTPRSVVSQSSLKQELKNNELVILNNKTTEYDNYLKEIILVSFNLDSLRYETTTDTNGVSTTKLVATAETGDTSYYTLQVNAYLNGRPLKTKAQMRLNTTINFWTWIQMH